MQLTGVFRMADAEDQGGGEGADPRLAALCHYCLKTLKVM